MSTQRLFSHLHSELKNNLLHYLILFTAGVFFISLLNVFRGYHLRQFFIVLVFINFYIAWGIAHHAVEKTLTLKTVLEYILIGATVLFLFEILLVR